MITMFETVEHLPRLTPCDLSERNSQPEALGNKAAFLRAAAGTMSKVEAACLRKLIDDSCERIDE